MAEWIPIQEMATLRPDEPGGHFMVHCELLGPHNVTSERMQKAIVQDLIPPNIVILSPSKASTTEGTVKLNVTVTDGLDPAPGVEWRLNSGDWYPYLGDDKLKLREGRNLIEVRAADAAGNVGTGERTITHEGGLSVGGTSWLLLLALLVVVAVVALWYWRNRTDEHEA
jgi:hypothetical protein